MIRQDAAKRHLIIMKMPKFVRAGVVLLILLAAVTTFAALWWDRAEDLRLALKAVAGDPTIGPHMDLSRVGAAGFSDGGFTALVAAGAGVDRARFTRFCSANPDDDVCRPQRESRFTTQDYAELLERPEIGAEIARAADDHSIGQVRSAFVMASALVQALQPASLEHLRTGRDHAG